MREQFRAWVETLQTFYLEVIFEERHDFKARVTRGILFGSSKLFQVVVQIHRWLIKNRILRDKTLGVQVIAIGNLTFGGTGKTPVVEKFARELQNAGRKVAILSRGYRSKPRRCTSSF
jgi:tetraacyldisaccharide 4'-kinase